MLRRAQGEEIADAEPQAEAEADEEGVEGEAELIAGALSPSSAPRSSSC